jgi:septal ring factor EnvC (AmiA/AmiB activator)
MTQKEILEGQIQALLLYSHRLNEEIAALKDANDHNVEAAQQWQREAEKAKDQTQYQKDRSDQMVYCLNGYKTECDRLQKEIVARQSRDYAGRKAFDNLRADMATLENKAHHKGWGEGHAAACNFHGVPEEGNTQVFSLKDRRVMQAKIRDLEDKLCDPNDY